MRYYFIYKDNHIPTIGGVSPNPPVDGRNIPVHIGLGNYNGLRLGYLEDINYFFEISQYNPVPVSEEIAEGFKILGLTQIPYPDPEIPDNILYRDLTETELANQQKARKMVYKIQLRNKIFNNVGDNLDIIADISKKISVVERILYKFLKLYYAENSTFPKFPELTLVQQYLQGISDGSIKNRIDYEDTFENLFNKLINRENNIASLVKSEYIDKN